MKQNTLTRLLFVVLGLSILLATCSVASASDDLLYVMSSSDKKWHVYDNSLDVQYNITLPTGNTYGYDTASKPVYNHYNGLFYAPAYLSNQIFYWPITDTSDVHTINLATGSFPGAMVLSPDGRYVYFCMDSALPSKIGVPIHPNMQGTVNVVNP